MSHLLWGFASGPHSPVFAMPSDVMLPFMYCDSMPTAIVVVCTPEGFVLGADGLGNDSKGSVRYSEQKIFSTECPSWTLAYTLSGAASILDDETGLDTFKEECRRIAEELKNKEQIDLGCYAEDFALMLGERIQKQIYQLSPVQAQHAQLNFAGYFKSIPAMAKREIRFHQGEFSMSQRDDKLPPRPNDRYLIGSQKIANLLLESKLDEFAKYRSPSFKKLAENGGVSLQEAIDAARSYIEACSIAKARDLDPACKFIGGDTCIATITLAEGFKWFEGLAPSVG
jgi:hypothetical protein